MSSLADEGSVGAICEIMRSCKQTVELSCPGVIEWEEEGGRGGEGGREGGRKGGRKGRGGKKLRERKEKKSKEEREEEVGGKENNVGERGGKGEKEGGRQREREREREREGWMTSREQYVSWLGLGPHLCMHTQGSLFMFPEISD